MTNAIKIPSEITPNYPVATGARCFNTSVVDAHGGWAVLTSDGYIQIACDTLTNVYLGFNMTWDID